MGFKTGVFLGLVVGAALAAVFGRKMVAEAPTDEEPYPAASGAQALREAIERLRQRASQALEAAHEAADEKEAELRRRYRQLSQKQA